MRSQRLIALAFILVQAWLIWATSGESLIPLTAGLMACVAALSREGLRLSGWLWNGSLLIVSGLVLFKCAQHPYSEELTSWVVPAPITLGLAEYSLAVQACLVFHRREDGGLSAALPVLGMLATAGVFNRTAGYDQQSLYLAAALTLTVLAALLFRRGTETRAEYSPGRGLGHLGPLAAVVVLTTLLGWQVSEQLGRNVGLLRPWNYDFGLANHRRADGQDYVRDATLHSVTRARNDEPSAVALRVYGSRSPGYLRGRVFDTYFGAQWHVKLRLTGSGRSGMRRLKPTTAISSRGLPRPGNRQTPFALDDRGRRPWTALRIVNDPNRSRVLFTPLGTGYLYGDGQNAAVDAHHIVRGGISTKEPYTAFVPRERLPVALSPRERERLLSRPAGLDPRVDQLALEVFQDRKTTRAKIDAVEKFFQDNFEYALGQLRTPDSEEPLSYFLLNRSPAHCEYFASGAVALLRLQGVPCRYVTGYIVEEQDEYGDYWLARNRHAHAWVEAFDGERKRWVIVEPTPGMSAPDDNDTGRFDLAEDAEAGDGGRSFVLAPQIFEGNWSVESFAAGLFVVAVGGLGGILAVRPDLRERMLGRFARHDPWLAAMHRSLRTMDRRLRRRRLKRRADETLHQFAERIRAAGKQGQPTTRGASNGWLECAADWYLAYATARYQSPQPAEQRPAPPELP